MSRETDEDYGLMYKDDPILGKTLSMFGAMVPWLLSVFLLTPLLVVAGLGVFMALNITPWIGLFASIIWIEMNP